MNKSNFLIVLLLLAVLVSTAIALSIARDVTFTSARSEDRLLAIAPPPQDDGQRRFSDANRVRPSSLSSDLRVLLAALGDRLERPGKERVSYVGLLQRSGEDRAAPFTLIWETPGKLRLQDLGRLQTTVFDGETVVRSDSSNTAFNDELLETLVYDSAEHLFLSQMRGASTRFLGSRFRLSETSEADSEPVYDVFEVTEPNITRQQSVRQTRQYFFNSDTQVLELVRYRTMKNGVENAVEVRFENFQRNLGQLFPMRIVRLENGTPIVTLTISSITVGPRLDDGIFATTLTTR